jgi:hypothetical protein
VNKKANNKRRVVREVILPYAFIALLLLLLASVRTVQTPVDITLNVEEVSYTYLGSPGGSVLDSRMYDDIYVANVTGASLTPALDSSRVSMRILPSSKGTSVSVGRAQINQLNIPRGTRVSLNWSAHTLHVSVTGPANLSLEVAPGAPLSCDYCTISGDPVSHELFRFPVSTAATFNINATDAVISLSAQADVPILAEDMSIVSPSFLAGSAEWPTSSITGPGRLAFPNIDTTVDVREREFLEIRRADHLKLVSIVPTKTGLRLHLSGQASDIRLGDSRNRLPSLLERLVKNQPLVLYCTAFGLVAGVMIKFIAQVNLN